MDPTEAALHLGITTELLFQYTKQSFAKASGLRSLSVVEKSGTTKFARQELDEFNSLLAGPWREPGDHRPPIPKAIVDHLRAESGGQCARCGGGIGIDNAHIRPWATSRSHHHANLVRICSGCHREHDAHNSLSSEQLQAVKDALVLRTRKGLQARSGLSGLANSAPQATPRFVGRNRERARVVEALATQRSLMITGLGGIGKTELLLQALRDVDSQRPLIWINVEQHRSASEVSTALRTAVARGEEVCPEAALPRVLDDLQARVVFDGVEQALLADLDVFEELLIHLLASTSIAQIIITSQVALHSLTVGHRQTLGALDASASRALMLALAPEQQTIDDNGIDELVAFCEGHALTLRLAAALRDHYGGAARALGVIEGRGGSVLQTPGRRTQTRRTSLELCLETAYEAFGQQTKRLLWALAACPAGVFVHYIEHDWIGISHAIDALGELKRWNFVDIAVADASERVSVPSPIRAFAAAVGARDETPAHNAVLLDVARGHELLVAVFETRYTAADQTPYVLERFGDELANFLHILHLATQQPADREVRKCAISITSALMRYFFVRGLNDEGCSVMQKAALIALEIGDASQASGLMLQQLALSDRAEDESIFSAGMELAEQLSSSEDLEVRGDVALARAMAARRRNDQFGAERHAQQAFEIYRDRLNASVRAKSVENAPGPEDDHEEMHNDISHALSVLGGARLAQGNVSEAARAYRHAMKHQRGTSVAVNRGQTLHQIGNCESRLGNHKLAVEVYAEAARIFHFIGMDHYLSNAVGELGYALLDHNDGFAFGDVDEDFVACATADLERHASRVFQPGMAIDHNHAGPLIRKTFGLIIFVSLTPHTTSLREFTTRLGDALREVGQKGPSGKRDFDELWLLATMDRALSLGFYAAQGDELRDDDTFSEIVWTLLQSVCNAHDWTKTHLRIVDWLSLLLTLRWGLKGADTERLRLFVQNFEDDVEDWLDLDFSGTPHDSSRP